MKFINFSRFLAASACLLVVGCQKSLSLAGDALPDCRPQRASVTVQCWSPYGEQLEQCKVVRENPPGCNFVEQAVKFSETLTLDSADIQRSGNWVMFDVARDDEGRIGRSSAKSDGTIYLTDPPAM